MKNIIFDFDGTLVDTAPLIITTMQAAMSELGLPSRSEAQCRATIGLRLDEIPSVLWPECKAVGQLYARTYRRIFDELKRKSDVRCFPGVIETLMRFHRQGYGMAIASSRSRRSLEEYIAQYGLTECFCRLVGGDDVAAGKPAPDAVLAILGEQGWDASLTLTVGDAPVDILMGRAAGTNTCAVTYGNGSLADLEAVSPGHIIDRFASLSDIMNCLS